MSDIEQELRDARVALGNARITRIQAQYELDRATEERRYDARKRRDQALEAYDSANVLVEWLTERILGLK